jgi:hypothetical protein
MAFNPSEPRDKAGRWVRVNVPATGIVVGDRLSIDGKTRVTKVHPRGEKILLATQTRGARSGSIASHDASATVPVYRKEARLPEAAPQGTTPRAAGMFGKGYDAMFGSGSPTATLPYADAARLKSEPMYDERLVAKGIADGVLEDVDPRNLATSQPKVTASGVKHYLDDPSSLYADQTSAGNAHPIVYIRRGSKNLLSGHHRAAAALLRGVPMKAIVVREDNSTVDLSMGDTSPLGKSGKRKLSDAERGIAHALMRKGHSKTEAIRMARGLLKKAAASGRWGDHGRASKVTRAKALVSIAQRKTF